VFTTLIGTSELAARLADPALVVVDVRHDLAQPDAGVRSRTAKATCQAHGSRTSIAI
jgi:hypothetical protein